MEKKKTNNPITAIVANQKGEIFELEGYAAAGMAGSSLAPLNVKETVNLPYGSELMYLPNRKPVLFNIKTKQFETVSVNPYKPGEALLPVAAFNSPGYLLLLTSAYEGKKNEAMLPLFSYGALGWHKGKFRSAAICVDRERRQDLRLMAPEKIVAGIHRIKKKLPHNRLRMHLETCALKYSCPAAKNFFLGRYEAPLPTARDCNARCRGCISLQKDHEISNCQERIAFTPSPEEISEIALTHIHRVTKGIVSFGQGCEGDPLMAAKVIVPAIKRIRSITARGTINMNTNASRPDILKDLFKAGLDSIRVSMNSARAVCYTAYFNPRGYQFSDVIKSIDLAKRLNKFISINYLNCPGFTDAPEEVQAFMSFLKEHPVDLIQWRNLNFDPIKYMDIMNAVAKNSPSIGMKVALGRIRKSFPKLKYGYFNPPKESFMSD